MREMTEAQKKFFKEACELFLDQNEGQDVPHWVMTNELVSNPFEYQPSDFRRSFPTLIAEDNNEGFSQYLITDKGLELYRKIMTL